MLSAEKQVTRPCGKPATDDDKKLLCDEHDETAAETNGVCEWCGEPLGKYGLIRVQGVWRMGYWGCACRM